MVAQLIANQSNRNVVQVRLLLSPLGVPAVPAFGDEY